MPSKYLIHSSLLGGPKQHRILRKGTENVVRHHFTRLRGNGSVQRLPTGNSIMSPRYFSISPVCMYYASSIFRYVKMPISYKFQLAKVRINWNRRLVDTKCILNAQTYAVRHPFQGRAGDWRLWNIPLKLRSVEEVKTVPRWRWQSTFASMQSAQPASRKCCLTNITWSRNPFKKVIGLWAPYLVLWEIFAADKHRVWRGRFPVISCTVHGPPYVASLRMSREHKRKRHLSKALKNPGKIGITILLQWQVNWVSHPGIFQFIRWPWAGGSSWMQLPIFLGTYWGLVLTSVIFDRWWYSSAFRIANGPPRQSSQAVLQHQPAYTAQQSLILDHLTPVGAFDPVKLKIASVTDKRDMGAFINCTLKGIAGAGAGPDSPRCPTERSRSKQFR